MEQILNWGKKDKIPQLKPKDVDGSFVTGASQDHLVGFHKLTIFTSQSNIRKLLVTPQVTQRLRIVRLEIIPFQTQLF